MKYELIKTDISAERKVMQDIIEDGEIVGQEETDEYDVTITMGIHPTDGIGANFSTDIIVRRNNAQTGFIVDIERAQAIEDYMQSINAVI